jgi:hypothetical protein
MGGAFRSRRTCHFFVGISPPSHFPVFFFLSFGLIPLAISHSASEVVGVKNKNIDASHTSSPVPPRSIVRHKSRHLHRTPFSQNPILFFFQWTRSISSNSRKSGRERRRHRVTSLMNDNLFHHHQLVTLTGVNHRHGNGIDHYHRRRYLRWWIIPRQMAKLRHSVFIIDRIHQRWESIKRQTRDGGEEETR